MTLFELLCNHEQLTNNCRNPLLQLTALELMTLFAPKPKGRTKPNMMYIDMGLKIELINPDKHKKKNGSTKQTKSIQKSEDLEIDLLNT
jgi:hypothetical protein